MIKQYGIEGLLSQSNGKAIEVDAEKEEASIPGELGQPNVTVKNFDNLLV